MWFLFCPPHGTSFPNPSPFEYDCSWRLPGSERWKGSPSCKHQPSTLKAPHALFQLSTALNYMFFNIWKCFRTAGASVTRVLFTSHHPLPALSHFKPSPFYKISTIVMYPRGGKVGREEVQFAGTSPCSTAWSLCSEVLQLQPEEEWGWVHTCTARADCKPQVPQHCQDLLLGSRWSWQSWTGEVRSTQPPGDGALSLTWGDEGEAADRAGQSGASLQGVNTQGHILSV